jgi:hypothetical protein
MEKLAQAGEGWFARPPPFIIFTITYEVAAEWSDKLTLFKLYQYMYVLCVHAKGFLKTCFAFYDLANLIIFHANCIGP